jgi:outer membrane protein insertion porin family
VLRARRRGSPAAARALAGWKARCAQGDAVACDTAQRVEATPAGPLPRAHFTGNAALSTETLEAAVGIDKPDGPLAEGASREDVIEHDTLVLLRLYYDHGYLVAQISPPTLSPSTDGAFLDVTFPIVEGPRYRLGTLTITERDPSGKIVPAPGGQDLRRLVPLVDGDWFSWSVLDDGARAVSLLYQDAGYGAVEARPKRELDPARPTVNVDIPVRRGPLVHVEKIEVLGNAQVTSAAIRKEIGMTEGQPYNETAILEAKRRLLALGAFRRVDVSTVAGSDEAHWKVIFEVEEEDP